MGVVKEDRLSLADFRLDGEGGVLACPQGHAPEVVKKKKSHLACFDACRCAGCPERSRCPVKTGRRYYYLRYTDKEQRLARRRRYERTEAFKERYRWRSGMEATMSEFNRRTGVKQLRVRGLKAVKYCAKLKALGVNMFRAVAFQIARLMAEDVLCAV